MTQFVLYNYGTGAFSTLYFISSGDPVLDQGVHPSLTIACETAKHTENSNVKNNPCRLALEWMRSDEAFALAKRLIDLGEKLAQKEARELHRELDAEARQTEQQLCGRIVDLLIKADAFEAELPLAKLSRRLREQLRIAGGTRIKHLIDLMCRTRYDAKPVAPRGKDLDLLKQVFDLAAISPDVFDPGSAFRAAVDLRRASISLGDRSGEVLVNE
jgi:hypothetical protein